MKKVLFAVFLLMISFYSVSAKDIAYSINKYDDEILNFIEKSYDKDLKEDGYVLGGSFLKEKIEKDDNTYDDYQVILVKYNKNDKIVWKYTYGSTKEDHIKNLSYSYDDNGNIDGYLIFAEKTYDILQEPIGTSNGVLLKIDFEGKLVFEKDINEGVIDKIIPTYDENNTIDGYISTINTQTGSSLVKYNKNFDIVFKRDFNDSSLKDLTLIKDNNKIIGYAIIQSNNLITIDVNGYNDVVLGDVSKYKTANLAISNNGFILYGITEDVKLKKGDSSYYLINYFNNEEVWETIGTTSASYDSSLVLLPILKDNKVKEYFLLYKNEVDTSYEVVKINLEGEIIKKIKKINNNYYIFNNFYSEGDTIYFIGQIKCPEDENCEYDNNSLYLVSDEDKVIEVQDNTSRNIIILFTTLFVILIVGVFVVRKKTSK